MFDVPGHPGERPFGRERSFVCVASRRRLCVASYLSRKGRGVGSVEHTPQAPPQPPNSGLGKLNLLSPAKPPGVGGIGHLRESVGGGAMGNMLRPG